MHRIESVLPEARFVHLVRDGRDVALSVLGMNWGPSTVPEAAFRWKKRILRAREQAPRIGHYVEIRYEDLVRDTEATLRRICEFVDLPYDEEMLRYHEHASERLQEKARDLDRGPDKAPQTAEARLESHALATQPPDPERIERWRTEMSVEDRAVYEELAETCSPTSATRSRRARPRSARPRPAELAADERTRSAGTAPMRWTFPSGQLTFTDAESAAPSAEVEPVVALREMDPSFWPTHWVCVRPMPSR